MDSIGCPDGIYYGILVPEPLRSRLQTCADTGCTSDLALSAGINLTFLGGRLRPRTFQDFSMSDLEAVFLGFWSGIAFILCRLPQRTRLVLS
jgi:hypothetical protein